MKEKFKQWCDDFFNGKQNKMSERDAEIYFKLTYAELLGGSDKPIDSNDETVPFIVRLMKKRSEFINLDISDTAIVALSLFCGSPGTAVMYLYGLKGKQLEDNKKVNMGKLSYTFPNGFYDTEHLNKMWDDQKIKSDRTHMDNMLDLSLDQLW